MKSQMDNVQYRRPAANVKRRIRWDEIRSDRDTIWCVLRDKRGHTVETTGKIKISVQLFKNVPRGICKSAKGRVKVKIEYWSPISVNRRENGVDANASAAG